MEEVTDIWDFAAFCSLQVECDGARREPVGESEALANQAVRKATRRRTDDVAVE